MKAILIDSCIQMIKALNILLSDGKITQEEYDQHVKLKLAFIDNNCTSNTSKPSTLKRTFILKY
jgi:hypothetical protein